MRYAGIIFIAFWSVLFLIACDSRQPSTIRDTKAPDFALLDLTGKEVKLADLIGAKPLVLDFWASWCPTCRAEIPEVIELHNQYKDKITIVGINLDHTLAEAQTYTRKHNIPYPNLYDEGNKVTGLYEIHGIPSLVIINAQGEIIKRNATLNDVKALAK